MSRLCACVALAVVVAVVGGCAEPEGPAARLFLQLVRADAGLDTSDVTGFVVYVGDARNVIAYDKDTAVVLELVAPPELATPFVVYGCTTPNAACRENDADFIGCTVVDLVANDAGIPVVVELDEISPLPAACEGLDNVTSGPVG